MRMSLTEIAQKFVYRLPSLSRWVAPRYRYKISPGELSFLCEAMTATSGSSGSILEIGVARGETSAFSLEHLRTTNDPRRVFFLDTFSGFTEDSIEYEVGVRGKQKKSYGAFRYGDEEIFARNLRVRGYENFTTVKGDASALDFAQFAPIDVVLLDIDLYVPTKSVLEKIWPHLATPGYICVDDCQGDTQWDGAFQAYQEFILSKGLDAKVVGGKGGVIIKR